MEPNINGFEVVITPYAREIFHNIDAYAKSRNNKPKTPIAAQEQGRKCEILTFGGGVNIEIYS